jgi:hypothetical protein
MAHHNDTRVYPVCCTSAHCGKTDCTGCKNLPVLAEFKAWVEKTGAKVTDPVWCPNVYTMLKR